MTAGKLKYLIYLVQLEGGKCTVTSLSEIFGVAKSTISRVMESFQKEGITYEGTLKLTEYGKKLGHEYLEERNRLMEWLCWYGNISEQIAREDAMNIMTSVSKTTKEVLLKKAEIEKIFLKLKKRKKFNGEFLAHVLEDGEYKFSFTFYKEKADHGEYISMANEGFHHPGILHIQNGMGVVRLTARMVENKSKAGDFYMTGRIKGMQYIKRNKFVEAGLDGNIYFFPVTAMEFVYNEEENLLQGSTKLMMSCSVGEMHMPASIAILTIFFR